MLNVKLLENYLTEKCKVHNLETFVFISVNSRSKVKKETSLYFQDVRMSAYFLYSIKNIMYENKKICKKSDF